MLFLFQGKFIRTAFRKSNSEKCLGVCGVKCYSYNKGITPVSMAYREFYHQKSKDDEAMIILHGMLGSKKNWNTMAIKIMQELKQTVYTVDARNHGGSPQTEEFSYEHLSEDVKYFLIERNLKRATVMGHSMGGRTAMVFALNNPQLVKDLISVDITPEGEMKNNTLYDFKAVLSAVEGVYFRDSEKSVHEARLSAYRQLMRKVNDEFIINFLIMHVTTVAPNQFGFSLNVSSIKNNFEKHINTFPKFHTPYEKPALFIYGTESDFVLPDYIEKTKRLFPKGEFVPLKTGHLLQINLPETFLKKVCEFIRKKK